MVIQEIYILQGGYNMEDFYYEETDFKQVFLKCMIFLFIVGVCLGVFLYYKKENTLKLKNIKINLYEELSTNLEDYVKSGKFSDEYKLYLNSVDNSKVGTYTYKVKYNKHVEYGKIIVQDNVKPIVETNKIVIGVNEKLNPNILITSCKDDSLPCSVELKNESDLILSLRLLIEISPIGKKE